MEDPRTTWAGWQLRRKLQRGIVGFARIYLIISKIHLQVG